MTYQRPAYEEVTIADGGNAIVLRPSLRAATSLEQRHGLPALYRAIQERDHAILCEIVLRASVTRDEALRFLRQHENRPLRSFFYVVVPAVSELLQMFMPAVDGSGEASGETMSCAQFYRDLYRIATGALCWTPAEAWAATPQEIREAFKGHISANRMARGESVGEKPTERDPNQAANNIAEGLDPEFDRAGLRALKTKISGGDV
ncbi:tail assembly chaperone [Rhizobium sp. PP-F2F-G48]|uniref:phage tail assembly chaperone n=1 Tax=Rhizobium sp. PP-F2F-G48 TaxID=2135651 RepID=UPI00104C5F4B|nr:phage tail assembly chaperone [Rhizobium sp. PP-F2F-G48]TCM57832.1 tail assembly chaperone [Rhizobium sp. PP-F2F-G48]